MSTIFRDSVSSEDALFGCPVEGCAERFKTKPFFWQHVSYKHFKKELLSNIPKRVGKYTQCPLCDHKTESTQKKVILYHYAIAHKIVHDIFAKKYPNHVLSSTSLDKR